MKSDICMWTKNGGWILPKTLARIDEVIPAENVHRKIMVDDKSTDETRKIGKEFNWEIYNNPMTGIANGANYALKQVDCETFISFEQDIFLNKEWFQKIPPLLETKDIAVASGIRFDTIPRSWRKLQEYVYREYFKEEIASYLRRRKGGAYTLGKTLDNTIYKTKAMKKVGGFPFTTINSGIDPLLVYTLVKYKYYWIVDPSCLSWHIRHSFKQTLAHHRWYGTANFEIARRMREKNLNPPKEWGKAVPNLMVSARRLAMSIGTGIFIAVRMSEPMIAIIHPLVRLYYFVGHLEATFFES